MDAGNSDLERRVLAHEWVLQMLIAHISEADPKFLERLQRTFTDKRHPGSTEQANPDTLAHAHQFVEKVVRLKAVPSTGA